MGEWWAALLPLAGVALGAFLTRGEGRRGFVRDVTAQEIQFRREHYAAFTKALWRYRSTVVRGLAAGSAAVQHRRAHPLPPGAPPTKVPFSIEEHGRLLDECRDAFADLQLFSSTPTQEGARAAMEAVTETHNRLVALDLDAAAAASARFEAHHEAMMNAINRDITELNKILYSSVTPLRRALLSKALRKPLAFELTGPPSDEIGRQR